MEWSGSPRFSFKDHVSAAEEIALLKAINTLPQWLCWNSWASQSLDSALLAFKHRENTR